MPSKLGEEATWLARLFRRPVFVTRTPDDSSEWGYKWRVRAPHEGQPEWDAGETAINRCDPPETVEW